MLYSNATSEIFKKHLNFSLRGISSLISTAIFFFLCTEVDYYTSLFPEYHWHVRSLCLEKLEPTPASYVHGNNKLHLRPLFNLLKMQYLLTKLVLQQQTYICTIRYDISVHMMVKPPHSFTLSPAWCNHCCLSDYTWFPWSVKRLTKRLFLKSRMVSSKLHIRSRLTFQSICSLLNLRSLKWESI